jgi:hypothetical protein
MRLLERPIVLALLAAFALTGGYFAYVGHTDISQKLALRAELAALDPIEEPIAAVAAAKRYLAAPAANIDPDAAAWGLAQYEKALRRMVMLNAGRDDAANEAELAEYQAMRQAVAAEIDEARR